MVTHFGYLERHLNFLSKVRANESLKSNLYSWNVSEIISNGTPMARMCKEYVQYAPQVREVNPCIIFSVVPNGMTTVVEKP